MNPPLVESGPQTKYLTGTQWERNPTKARQSSDERAGLSAQSNGGRVGRQSSTRWNRSLRAQSNNRPQATPEAQADPPADTQAEAGNLENEAPGELPAPPNQEADLFWRHARLPSDKPLVSVEDTIERGLGGKSSGETESISVQLAHANAVLHSAMSFFTSDSKHCLLYTSDAADE